MNLTLETLLLGGPATLRERIAPTIEDSFATEAARLAALLLTSSASAVDDAAAARVWENASLRALFADAQSRVDADLARRFAETARSVDPGLKISKLDRENYRLRTLLVKLHAAVETDVAEAAHALDARIGGVLRVSE